MVIDICVKFHVLRYSYHPAERNESKCLKACKKNAFASPLLHGVACPGMTFPTFRMISGLIPVVLLLGLFHIAVGDEIYSKNENANKLYKKGEYEDALKLYEDALLLSPSEERLKANKGAAEYQMGNYEKAQESFKNSLSIKNKQKRADIHYNLGNTLFKHGEQLQKAGNPSAQEKYKAAIEEYIKTLDIRPNDTDTKWNLQLAHKRIQEIKQQQQQQQNSDKQNKDKKDKNKNDQQQKQDQQKRDENEQSEQQQNKDESE
jgi:tetratricopeptide (TPR) repeat protein